MIDLEAEMAKALEGKFFWEKTAFADETSIPKAVVDIRKAQKKFAGNAVNYSSRTRTACNTESIKPMKRVLRGEEKVIEPILKAISQAYDVAIDDLLGHSHAKRFSKAKKHLNWALFRYITGMTTAEAGRLLQKCHTTVIYNRAEFEKNQDFEKVVEVDRLMGRI